MVTTLPNGDVRKRAVCGALLGSWLRFGGNPFNINMNIKEKVTEKLGQGMVEQNPFLTSEQFMTLLKATASLAKVVMLASKGPSEAMNGIQSLMVTFLKNIPDKFWDVMKEIVTESKGEHPASEGFKHMDAIRNYGEGKFNKFVEFTDEGHSVVVEGDDLPPVNAPMPKHTC